MIFATQNLHNTKKCAQYQKMCTIPKTTNHMVCQLRKNFLHEFGEWDIKKFRNKINWILLIGKGNILSYFKWNGWWLFKKVYYIIKLLKFGNRSQNDPTPGCPGI